MRKKRRTDIRAASAALLLSGIALAAPSLGDDEAPPPPDAVADGSLPPDAADEPADEAVVVKTRVPAVTRFPDYPPTARRDRIEGEATVCFKVTPDGRVLDPVVRSSTHEIFEKPALEAIRSSTFEPLAAGELAAAERSCRTFRFRLDPAEANTV